MRMTGNSALQELFDASGAAELIAADVKFSATALHHGANDWSRALRRAGIARGDRIVCALPNGPAFIQLLVACLADGVTLAPVPTTDNVVPLLDSLDARLAIAETATHAHVAVPGSNGGPPSGPLVGRIASARTDAVAFLLRSSGTAGTARWIALSEAGVLATLESHLPKLGVDGASVLCALPWSHAFGLVLGLLPALLRARRIVTTASDVRDEREMIALARAHAISNLSMVPLMAARLVSRPDGMALLQSLTSGLVGGAPIDAALARALANTQLRVGYGQTEAGPGIMLGEPGEFHAAFLGRPVGCAVRIDADGVLAFRGPSACTGFWQDGALQSLEAERWQRTDDFAVMENGAYFFRGRASLTFKLANGKLVLAPQLEARLRQRIPRLSDIVLTSADGLGIDATYSTLDSASVDEQSFRDALGGLHVYLRAMTRMGADAWPRTPKGEIDRRRLPSSTQ